MLYLWNLRPILLARACSSSTVCPQAALISFHSTGTLGSRPSLKLLMVPNWPLCLQQGQLQVSALGRSSFEQPQGPQLLGSLFQSLRALLVKKFLLIPNLNLLLSCC